MAAQWLMQTEVQTATLRLAAVRSLRTGYLKVNLLWRC